MTSLSKKIPLMEKFGPTIQGEGATIGLQTYFLRFGLCDYKCVMCDSMHAVDPESVRKNALWLTQAEIGALFDPVKTSPTEPFPTKWITLSGGNPCIHDLQHLLDMLKAWDYSIAVETQGTLCPDWLNDCDIVTISPKSPGMGEQFDQDTYRYFVNNTFSAGINTKVVIFSKEDVKFAEHVAEIWQDLGCPMSDFYLSQGNPFPPGKGAPISLDFQANMLRSKYLELFDMIKQSKVLSQAKWLPQWHVWLWGNKAGV